MARLRRTVDRATIAEPRCNGVLVRRENSGFSQPLPQGITYECLSRKNLRQTSEHGEDPEGLWRALTSLSKEEVRDAVEVARHSPVTDLISVAIVVREPGWIVDRNCCLSVSYRDLSNDSRVILAMLMADPTRLTYV